MDFPKTLYFERREVADVVDVLRTIEDIYPKESNTSLAHQLLCIDEFKSRLECLESRVMLVDPSNPSGSDSDATHGRVCIYRVKIKPSNKQLTVHEPKVSLDQFKSIQHLPRAFLIASDSVSVIDTKLAVYKKYKDMFENNTIRILHELDSNKEVLLHCVKYTIDAFKNQVERLVKSIPISKQELQKIVEKAAGTAFSRKEIQNRCKLIDIVIDGRNVGSIHDGSYSCRSPLTIRRIKNVLIAKALEIVEQVFTNEVLTGYFNYIQKMIEAKLKHEVFEVRVNIQVAIKIMIMGGLTIAAMKSSIFALLLPPHFQTIMAVAAIGTAVYAFIYSVDVNSLEWRNKIANEIYNNISAKKAEIVDEVLEKLKPVSDQTVKDLREISVKLATASRRVPIADQRRLIDEWLLRDFRIENIERCPSIVNYVTGRKNGLPVMKVFLQKFDLESKRFCESHVVNKPAYSRLEFVDVSCESDSEKIKDICKEEMKESKIDSDTKIRIKNILKHKRGQLFAKHSNLIAIGMSPVKYSDGCVLQKPCIVLYSFDEVLVPFGEEPLPTALKDSFGEFPCDIREDFVQLERCLNCQGLQNGCSVGQYGVNSSGSVGFFVSRKSSSQFPQLPYDGFLTAAHVALENDVLKEMKEKRFSNFSQEVHVHHLIVHPSLEDSGTNNVIGEVEDSFFGNHESIGVDAAFVKTYKHQENGEMYESSLFFDVDPNMEYKVFKEGRTTGKTTGILKDSLISFRNYFPERAGIYLVLDNCFTIYRNPSDPFREFFLPGDSGAAVYLVEETDNTNHPLGLAFGVLGRHKITFASPIKAIADILNLSVVQPAQPMNMP